MLVPAAKAPALSRSTVGASRTAFSRKILLAARPRPSGRIVDSPGQRGREMSLVGKWRITQMDVWSQDEFDLVGPGFPRKRGRG